MSVFNPHVLSSVRKLFTLKSKLLAFASHLIEFAKLAPLRFNETIFLVCVDECICQLPTADLCWPDHRSVSQMYLMKCEILTRESLGKKRLDNLSCVDCIFKE